ncbi:MAG: tripartite tricarboxylate transporter TctB family protein [Planctomycetes bacterium]|nr:tripartite tricarboxylate transporter TctB family protein [Planctomycetota bacterium]
MKKGNYIAAAAFAALALFAIRESGSFPPTKGNVPGPAVFPVAIAVIMLAAAVSLVISTFRIKPEDDRKLNLGRPECLRVYACMAILIVYFPLVQIIGFCVTSSIMLFGLIRWFGKYPLHQCALAAVAIVGSLYFVFSQVLLVPFRFGFLL